MIAGCRAMRVVAGLLVFAIGYCGWHIGAAAGDMEVFPLRNRPAEEIVPIIQPLIGSGASVSGQGYTLIVKAPPQARKDIAKIVETLDVVADMLLVSVRQGKEHRLREEEHGAQIDISHNRGASIRAGTPVSGVATLEHRAEASRIASGVSTWQTRARDTSRQSVSVMEGREAYIAVGVSVPYGVRRYDDSGHWFEAIEFRDLTTGFVVLPRLRGDQVVVEVSPQKQSFADQGRDQVALSQLHTVVRGRLGEWMRIGSVGETAEESRDGILYRAGSALREEGAVYLKVDRVE